MVCILTVKQATAKFLSLVIIIYSIFRVVRTIEINPNIIAVLPLHAMIIAIYFITFPIHSFS